MVSSTAKLKGRCSAGCCAAPAFFLDLRVTWKHTGPGLGPFFSANHSEENITHASTGSRRAIWHSSERKRTRLLANSISQAQLNRRFTEVLQGTSQFTDDEFEPAANMIRAKEKLARTRSFMWKIMAALTAGLVVLLFVKMGNTSEMALRYSNSAQEELGTWVLGIAAMAGVTALMVYVTNAGRKKTAASKAALVAALRQRASAPDDSRKAAHESLLRQLGA